MQKTRDFHKLIAIALLLPLLAWPASSAAQDKAPEKIRIAIATSSLAFLVPFVAKDRGFYLKHGSEVELIQMRPNISVAALLSGEIEYIELIGSAIRSAARGLPIRAISTGIKSPFFSIIAQNKYKSIKDLKGAIIGLTSIGGTNHISTRITLRQFGLDPEKDVKLIAIGDEKIMYRRFQSRPRRRSRTRAAVFGAVEARRFSYSRPDRRNTSPFLSPAWVRRSSESKTTARRVKRVLKAEIEALRFIQSNAAGTAEVIRKRFSMDEKLARESYDVVVDAFSRDGRVPLEGVDILAADRKGPEANSRDRHTANGRGHDVDRRSVEGTRQQIN